jgi:hypothetical protein
MALLIFYCGITSLGFTSFTTNILEDLINNWKQKPIVDIIEGKGICPILYEPLLKDVWPGTNKGCDCSADFFPFVYNRRCRKDDYFCRNMSPIKPIELNIWDGVLLCAKRHTYNYLDLLKQDDRMGCPIGMKKCGKLDNTGKGYCVQENENCFVNKIVINNINEVGSIQLGYSKYFSFTTSDKSSDSLIINSKISQGKVCLDPHEVNTNDKPYKLINEDEQQYYCTNNINSNYYDDRYKRVDSSPLHDYYNFNRLTPILSGLPLYPFPNAD